MGILVPCTGNSARSILPEAISGDLGFNCYSTGSNPAGPVHSNAANETPPIWPGTPLRAHWGVKYQAAASPDARPAATKTAYQILNRQTHAFALLPQHKRHSDAAAQIGQIG